MDRYRPRGRVDSDLGIEMGYGCRELYKKNGFRESLCIKKNGFTERERERERDRERAVSEKMRERAYNKGVG